MAKKKKFSIRDQFRKDMRAHEDSFLSDDEWTSSQSVIGKHLREQRDQLSVEDATSSIDVGAFTQVEEPSEPSIPSDQPAEDEALTQFDVSAETPVTPDLEPESISTETATAPQEDMTVEIAQPELPENQLVDATSEAIVLPTADVRKADTPRTPAPTPKPTSSRRQPSSLPRSKSPGPAKSAAEKRQGVKDRKKEHLERRSKRLQEQYRQKYGIQSKNEQAKSIPTGKPAAGQDRTSTDVNFRAQIANKENFQSTEAAGDATTSYNEIAVRNMERITDQLTYMMTRLRIVENSLDRARA